MRKFIKRLVIFGTVLIIPIVVFSIGAYIILSNSNYWKLPEKIDYIVLGHSHPECAFNDSLIPDLLNLGKSGESYFYTYLKVKKIIQNNKNLKTVFIEFGNNNINSIMDSWTWDDRHIQQNFPRYFPLLDYSDFKFLMGKNSNAILNCPSSRFIKEFGYTYLSSLIIRKNFLSNTRFGGYLYLVRDKTESLLKNSLLENKDNKVIDKDISKTNLKYLQKIIELCNKNNVNIFLIRSPVHSKYTTQNSEIKFRRILKLYFKNYEFIDFASFPLQNNEYGDFGHLNNKGARKFSIWFNQLLMNNLLKETRKQEIINKTIKARTHNKGSYVMRGLVVK